MSDIRNNQVSPQELEQAFNLFNQASAELAGAYHELQQQVERLTTELAVANGELRRQFLEKEALSQRLGMLLAALPAGVVVLDQLGIVREANAAAKQMLGEPLLEQSWEAVAARDLRQTATPHEWELGGEAALQLSISSNPLDSAGGCILLLHDITEAHVMQIELERHRRLSAMGEMAAGLAHQLRTPLATALLYTANLGKAGLPEGERVRFAEKALARLRHLEHLIQDMLLFVKGETGERESFPISALLAELQQIMEPQMAQHGVPFSLADRSGGSCIMANRKPLVGALVNLLENAMQACQGGGEVCLGAGPVAAGQIALVVKDTGRGFDASVEDRLFEPFFTTRAEGTGLGLAIVRNVVQAHGGEVRVKSAPGAGSEFVVLLPATSVPA
jgi:two-component system sensor histidine kinase FlrB